MPSQSLTPKGFVLISPGFPIPGYGKSTLSIFTLKGLRLPLIPHILFIVFDFVIVEKTEKLFLENKTYPFQGIKRSPI
jgi:hypothetical protein